MLAAHSLITERVRERVRAERLDLSADPTVAERLVRDESPTAHREAETAKAHRG